jgi:broad specificity phosphatase PhoE
VNRIILIRHGETEWNIKEIFRGRIDIKLNETGIKQVELLARYLSPVEIQAIYSSPLKRALETARVIAGYHQIDVEIAPGLTDFNYGRWQGLPLKELRDEYPELYAEWILNPHQVKMPGGESLDDVRTRATAVVDNIISQKGEAAAIVSHRVVNKVLICALLGLDNSHFWNVKQDVCGITTFTYEKGRFILTSHNDTSFLKPIPKAPLSDF